MPITDHLHHWFEHFFPHPHYTRGSSASSVTAKALRKLISSPDVPSRNGPTKELEGHTLHIHGDCSPYTVLGGRGNNVFATIAETLWVYAGRNDVGPLLTWLPIAKDYSDDWNEQAQEGHWRAGYGPRLRSWVRRDGGLVDQLAVVLERLRMDGGTRQALMNLTDPDKDSIFGSKDYACNLIIHFLVRGDRVGLHVYVRSNDVVFGVNINLYEWLFVARYIASALGKNAYVGDYWHTASSLHLYQPHFDKARKVVARYRRVPTFPYNPQAIGQVSPDELTSLCNEAFNLGRAGTLPHEAPDMVRDMSRALYSENALISGEAATYVELANQVEDHNLFLALMEIGQRRLKQALWDTTCYERALEQRGLTRDQNEQVTEFLWGQWKQLSVVEKSS